MSKTKTMLVLVMAGAVVFTMVLWFYNTKQPLEISEYAVAVLVGVIVLASIIVASKRIKNEKRGLTPEDEMSVRIKERAAAISFSVSFIMWVFILLFFADKDLSNSAVVGIGIIAQGLLFFGLLFYYNKKGL